MESFQIRKVQKQKQIRKAQSADYLKFKLQIFLSLFKDVQTPQQSILPIQKARSQEDALASHAFSIQNLKFKRRLHLKRKVWTTPLSF